MYVFIVNPNARTGLGIKTWRILEAMLVERNVSYKAYLTQYQRHATKIAQEVTKTSELCTIVALGGDGTLNEVINGIDNFSSVTLAYIPIGSSNDFARGMELSRDLNTALDRILAPSAFSYLNVGVLDYKNKKRHFAVSAGLGFDAEVCHRLPFSKLKYTLNKIALGKLCYVGVALQSLLLQTPKKMTVTLDGKQTVSFDKVYFAAFMNQKYEGGGFMFCPNARPDDDVLDLIVVEGLSKLKILCLLPTAFWGRHTIFRGIHTYRCRRADIVSEIALPVHTDGEPIFLQRQASAYLAPQKLRFIHS